MNKIQFAQTIKEKHPEYRDVDDIELADRVLAKYPVYQERITDTGMTPQVTTGTTPATAEFPQEQKRGVLRKVADFFTGSAQRFGDTLGTATSVIDPVTRKLREETLTSAQEQADNYLKMAQQETDKERKASLLEAAQIVSDTEDIDIFNRPEYQKTAKQVYGEALGTVAETVGWGKTGALVKNVRMATMGQTALRGAITGGAMGTAFGTARAMEEDASASEIGRSAMTGGVGGAVLGGVAGGVAGKIAGKISSKKASRLVSPRLGVKERATAYKSGKMKSPTLLRREKFVPGQEEKSLGKLAQEMGVKGKPEKDLPKISGAIETEATKIKKILKDKGGIYNKNTIKGQLNKMKADKTADLVDAEVGVYDKMIAKFNKLADNKKNKGLDGLLEVRQEFDKWATSNNPRIFDNKTGGAYRALTSVRNTINDYINQKAGDDVVKNSMKKQSNLFRMFENVLEKASKGETKLKPSQLKQLRRRSLPYFGTAGVVGVGGYLLGKGKGGK